MDSHKLTNLSILIAIILAIAFLAACSSQTGTPALDGQALMQQRCSVCHSLDRVTSAHHTPSEWQATVDRMVARGAQLTPSEEQVLLAYLEANYK